MILCPTVVKRAVRGTHVVRVVDLVHHVLADQAGREVDNEQEDVNTGGLSQKQIRRASNRPGEQVTRITRLQLIR